MRTGVIEEDGTDVSQGGSGLEVWSLFSGSKGNCTYIRCAESEILIDAGKSFSAVSGALKDIGSSIDRISAVFVTHEHADHIKGLPMIFKKSSAVVHMTEESAERSGLPKENLCDVGRLVCHPHCFSVKVGGMTVSSFELPHDSAMCVGYRIDSRRCSAGIATDCGFMPRESLECLRGCSAVIIEANHDTDRLMGGPYPEYLKQRILSDRGHLSNDACGELAAELGQTGTNMFLLSHLSEENNTPELALRSVSSAIARRELSGTLVCVASQYEPTRLI